MYDPTESQIRRRQESNLEPIGQPLAGVVASDANSQTTSTDDERKHTTGVDPEL